MKNLILIGNGFDLSHNLKTRYSDFVDKTDSKSLDFNYKTEFHNPSANICDGKKTYKDATKKNELFKLITKSKKELWCDIETIYFSELKKSKEPSELNSEFERVKEQFEIYLSEETKEIDPLNSYQYLFNKFKDKPYIINFNYTKSAKLYQDSFRDIIHLHGEINNKLNPIIFGYAADQNETNVLLEKDNDEYLKNIKQYEYLGTNNFRQTLRLIENSKNINVFLLGLSCGLSDKLILQKIFSHEHVKNIFNFYYKNRKSHLKKLMSINRIVHEDVGFQKFVPMPNCLRIPQHDKELSEEGINNFFKLNAEYGL